MEESILPNKTGFAACLKAPMAGAWDWNIETGELFVDGTLGANDRSTRRGNRAPDRNLERKPAPRRLRARYE